MPREPWRDDPEYLALWRESRLHENDVRASLVLSDWLEEHGHLDAMWRERLRGLSGSEPQVGNDVVRAGFIPIGQGAWRLLLAAPPPDRLLILFRCNVQAYQYIRQFPGRCGWDMGQRDWPSETEREHLCSIPRLQMLASSLMTSPSWEWITQNLTELTHLELDGPWIDANQLAHLRRLPKLCHLALEGRAANNTTALTTLEGLKHLTLGPYEYRAGRIEELAPNAESLKVDMEELGETVRWPRLRSYEMSHFRGEPMLGEAELIGLARYPLIERLDVRCDGISPAALAALAAAPRLRELKLRNEGGSLPSLEPLAGSSSLETLTIESEMDETRLMQLCQLPGLRHLTLTYVRTGARGIESLACVRTLETLTLSGEFEGDKPPLALAELPLLELLDLRLLEMPRPFAEAICQAVPGWVHCPLRQE